MLGRGFVGAVLVLLGGMVVAAIPDSSRWHGVAPLETLRTGPEGRMLGLTVVLLGLGLLAAEWLRLCRRVAASRHEVDEQDRVVRVRAAAAVWSLPLLVAPPLFSRDGWSYAAQGALAHVGLSPYEHGPSAIDGPVVEAVDPMWMDTPAPYGPLPLGFGEVLAGTTLDPWALVVGHRLLALVGLVLLAWAVPRLARWCGTDPALASAIALASPFVVANGVAGLHNDLLMAGLVAAALVAAVEHGWVPGAVLAGSAAAVKGPGALVGVAVVLVSLPAGASLAARLRRTAAVAAVAIATLHLWSVVTGLGWGWVEALSVPSSITTVLSATALVDELAGTDVVRTLGTAATFLLAAVLTLRRPTGDRAAAVGTAWILMLAALVLAPVVHLWYALWVVPLLAAARLPRAARTAVVAASVLLGLCAPLDSSLHGAFQAIVLGVVLVAALAAVLLVTRRSRHRVRGIVAAAGRAYDDADQRVP
jgi:hypothetical protein